MWCSLFGAMHAKASAHLHHLLLCSPSSPLYALSLAEMEARMVQVLVFVDGVDAMTSKQLQARGHAWWLCVHDQVASWH